jgi:catechol 2,3-dioxygenase-like lactoylglutathione lyase family enzyme
MEIANNTEPARVFGLGHVLIQVSDLAAAEAFYIGFLGLTLRRRGRLQDGRDVTVTEEGIDLAPGRPDVRDDVVDHIGLRAANIAEFERRAREQGVMIARGPRRGLAGMTLHFFDPDGNVIEVYGDQAD